MHQPSRLHWPRLEAGSSARGATTDAVLPRLNRASVTAALDGVVTADNQLCSDGGKALVGFARNRGIPCQILPSSGGTRPYRVLSETLRHFLHGRQLQPPLPLSPA